MRSYPHGVTVSRLRGAEVSDGYGGTILDWDNPTTVQIDGCAVAPRIADEERDRGRQGVNIGWTVYAPGVDHDITHLDRMEIPAGVFEVEGDPNPWSNPYTGNKPGTVIQLRRLDG